MLASLYPVRDMRLSGQVIHTGNSSMEVAVRMEAIEKDGSEETIMLGMDLTGYILSGFTHGELLGRFCMVARRLDGKVQEGQPADARDIRRSHTIQHRRKYVSKRIVNL